MKNFFVTLFLIFILVYCSAKNISFKTEANKNQANITVNSIYLWIDKMPSNNKQNNLKLSSDLIIEPSKDYDVNLLKLSRIQVYQDSLLVYNFKPIVKDNPSFNKKGKRNVIVSTIENTELPLEFDIKKDNTVYFIFEYNKKLFINTFNKIKVDVTY